MLGKARRGSLIPKGDKPEVRVKETRGSTRKVLYGCKRPGEISRISVWVQETRGDVPNFCEGVRDPWRNPKFLCGCKRPVEKSEISVWV